MQEPSRGLSHAELVDLFYHKAFQFSRGSLALPLLGQSLVAQQASLKREAVKQQQDQASGMQHLILKHFRSVADVSKYYSLPRNVLSNAYLEDIRTASSVSFAKRGESFPTPLALSDRARGSELPVLQNAAADGAEGALLQRTAGTGPGGPSAQADSQMELESDDDTFLAPPQAGQQNQLALPKLQILDCNKPRVQWPGDVELMFFKVAHKSVHALKRPMRNLDNILPDDLALRFYEVIHVADTGRGLQVQLVPRDDVDVCASSLFTDWKDSGISEALMFTELLEWDAVPEVSIQQSRLPAFACLLIIRTTAEEISGCSSVLLAEDDAFLNLLAKMFFCRSTTSTASPIARLALMRQALVKTPCAPCSG